MQTTRGWFISVEGIDGSGKSTHVQFIASYLQKRGKRVVVTREPGGTEVGEKIRDILLHVNEVHRITELLLMFASRQELIYNVVKPNLDSGVCVVTDRFIDASIAYQGAGREIGAGVVDQLINLLEPKMQTDLTLLFDAPLSVAMERIVRNRNKDRIEKETKSFFTNVQNEYHKIYKTNGDRVKLINTDQPIEQTQADIIKNLDLIINREHVD